MRVRLRTIRDRFKGMNKFKQKFRIALSQVLLCYPKTKVEVDHGGLKLDSYQHRPMEKSPQQNLTAGSMAQHQPVISHPDKSGVTESLTEKSTRRNPCRGKRSERKVKPRSLIPAHWHGTSNRSRNDAQKPSERPSEPLSGDYRCLG